MSNSDHVEGGRDLKTASFPEVGMDGEYQRCSRTQVLPPPSGSHNAYDGH